MSLFVDLDFPLPRTHCGFTLGNGLLGALVWGAETLNVTINRADFWDHRGGEKIEGENLYKKIVAAFHPVDPAPVNKVFGEKKTINGLRLHSRRMPMGRFEFTPRRGLRPGRGRLNLRTGELSVWMRDKEGRETAPAVLFLDPAQPVVSIADPEGVLGRASFRTTWEWTGDKLASFGVKPPVERRGKGETGWAIELPADPAMAALCRKIKAGWLVAMAPGATADKAFEACKAEMNRFAGRPKAQAEARAWWARYWRRSAVVKLPDREFQRLFNYALFKFAAATSPLSPLPAALQGPWAEEYQLPPWSCDYHFNVNIQQIYTLAFAVNQMEHLLPLFNMLEASRGVFRDNARALVGIEDGLVLNHAIDDRGYACGGISAGSSIDHAVSGWTALLFWMYYQSTGDKTFLRDRAMPFMRAVMRVYEEMLVEENGRLSIPVSISAEYQVAPGQRCGKDPSYQLACAHALADALIAGARVLGESPAPAWLRIKEKLPPWTLAGPPEKRRIAVMDGVDFTIPHRHHSHLGAIYPFDTLGKLNAEQAAIVENSIHHWLSVGMSDCSEWCLPWAAILEARVGYTEGPWLLLKIWRDLFINEGLATAYIPRFKGFTVHRVERMVEPLEKYEVMQLDGTMAGATAMCEMLVHHHGGVARFFPAAPKAWKDVSFERVRLPGPFLTSGARRNGAFAEAAIEAPLGGEITVDVAGEKRVSVEQGGRRKAMDLPLTLKLNPGETVRLAPG